MGWLKWLLSVNPKWRSSLMDPVKYRPPSSTELPYKPPIEPNIAEHEYRYSKNRDSRTKIIQETIIKDSELPTLELLEEIKPQRYQLAEVQIPRNKDEYFNIRHFQ